jgi:hypothetical protein
MVEQDPKQVIIDFLNVPRAGKVKAKATAIHFLKERIIPGCQLHAVAFEDEFGQHFHAYFALGQDLTSTWHMSGATLSEGDPGTHDPVHNQPWVSLFGGGGYGNDFYAGGYVNAIGAAIESVHLVSDNGIVLKDSVENGLVLFVTDQPVEMPVKAELYDQTGQLVASHNAFPIPY